jgi:hypothetical protein
MYFTMFGCRHVSGLRAKRSGEDLAYVLDLPHDFHLVLYLLIQDAVLHELAFIKFLRGIRLAGEPQGHFGYRGEGAPANFAHAIVLGCAGPLPW